MRSFRGSRLRIRLVAASFVLSLLIAGAAVAALVVVLHRESAQTIAARLQERVTALAATVVDRNGRVDVIGADEALFDGPNWVYSTTGRQLEGPTSNGTLTPVLRDLSMARSGRVVRSGPWHLRSLPVRSGGSTAAVVVTGVNDDPYAATLGSTVRDAVLLGLLAVLGATLLAALVLSRGLGPISVMTEQAAGWSRSASRGRFALGPPRDEIGQLAAVLDDLLDRVDAALAAERRLTAEIAHELRTPLTLLIGEAQLALMDGSSRAADRARFERIETAAQGMARAITVLLADATAAAERDAEADVRAVVEQALAVLDFAGSTGVEGASPRAALPSDSLERMLAPVLANAATMARSAIGVSIGCAGDVVEVRVVDDGPGVDPSVVDSLFTPGVTARSGGTGLGLALARRLARDAGGDVRLDAPRPATFVLRLPVAAAVDAR